MIPEMQALSPTQSFAQKADLRLKLLAEHNKKHKEIAADIKSRKIEKGANIQEIAEKKQVELDQPTLDYFVRSWIKKSVVVDPKLAQYNQPLEKTVDDIAQQSNKVDIQEIFKKNKEDIKQNYMLAQDLNFSVKINHALEHFHLGYVTNDATVVYNDVIQLHSRPSTMMFAKLKDSEYKVADAYYYGVQNPVDGKVQLGRSGVSKNDIFQPVLSSETIDAYAQRIKDRDNAIKYDTEPHLMNQIRQENTHILNETLPKINQINMNTFWKIVEKNLQGRNDEL
jgi:hypothetical protein